MNLVKLLGNFRFSGAISTISLRAVLRHEFYFVKKDVIKNQEEISLVFERVIIVKSSPLINS